MEKQPISLFAALQDAIAARAGSTGLLATPGLGAAANAGHAWWGRPGAFSAAVPTVFCTGALVPVQDAMSAFASMCENVIPLHAAALDLPDVNMRITRDGLLFVEMRTRVYPAMPALVG